MSEFERTADPNAVGMSKSNVEFKKVDAPNAAPDDVNLQFADASSNEGFELDNYLDGQNAVINNID